MKTRFSGFSRLLFAVCAVLCAGTFVAQAQLTPLLDLQLSGGYAQLSMRGVVGTVWEVQYVTNLAQTNAWLWLSNLTLASSPQPCLDTSCPATGNRFYRAVLVPTNMVLISAGSFMMGDCMGDGPSEERPLHTVYVSGFYMDQYLVTKSLWDTVKAWNGGNGYGYDYAGSGKAGNHPVQTVNWYDVIKWCNARSQREALTPCYYTDSGLTALYKTGDIDNIYVSWAADGYRLPTEAEWEKAARGGANEHRFPWSDADTITHGRANYYSASYLGYDISPTRGYHPTFNDGTFPCTSPVGYFAANGYGLYDMAGNVHQWCWDWFLGTYYSSSPGTDPRGPASGTFRLPRGGSWGYDAYRARCAFRYAYAPWSAYNDVGFRCVRRL